jgi:hypothetical protein
MKKYKIQNQNNKIFHVYIPSKIARILNLQEITPRSSILKTSYEYLKKKSEINIFL